jgi:hypothetical protein
MPLRHLRGRSLEKACNQTKKQRKRARHSSTKEVGETLGTLGQCVSFSLIEAGCHTQSSAATNRVTEQLNWLTVESSLMSCSISWMASLIDNLYLLDLIVLVIN